MPLPSLGDLLDSGIEPGPLALQVDSLPTELSGKLFLVQPMDYLWSAIFDIYVDYGSCFLLVAQLVKNPPAMQETHWEDGEGIGYPLQYSWASLVAQLVKNLPAMWETWVQTLGW